MTPRISNHPDNHTITLTELADRPMTLRDAVSLLPATLISLVLNTAFVLALIWFNTTPATGAAARRIILADEETRLDAEEKQELDLRPEELDNLPDVAPSRALEHEPALDSRDTLPTTIPPDRASLKDPGTADDLRLPPGLQVIGPPGANDRDGPGQPTNEPPGTPGPGVNPFDVRRPGVRDGGTFASEAAVVRGLQWLAAHQSPDGRWSLDKYHTHNPTCRCKDLKAEAAVEANDTAATGLGLLPFLGAGHHHRKQTSFTKNVLKGLNFLVSRQESNGDLKGGMYGHGLATIALCEAYGMSSDAKLRFAAQKAIDFIVFAQNEQTGGWHYAPKGVGDTSVVGWQVMALRSGQMAGLNVPAKSLDGARKWLDRMARDEGARYVYNPDTAATPAITAVGLLNRQYLGWGPRNPALHRGCEYLLTNLPQAKPSADETLGPIYYYYYATQVMHHMEGKYFETWNPLMREKLIRLQEKEGHKSGSWSAAGTDHGNAGGRIYTTSLATLTLEVYYRYMPLYRRTETP
jgi:hypothetical protein